MRASIIGLGRLGLPVSCAMVARGHEVYGYDTDRDKVEQYRGGISGLYEPGLDGTLEVCLESGLHLVNTVAEAVRPAEIIFVAVPTPSLENGAFDTAIVADVLRPIAATMTDCDDYKVVAIISTVLPGTVRAEFLPVLEEALGPPGERYGLAYNAQFIAMGTVVENMLFPEFVLVGEYDERSGEVLDRFYTQLVRDAPVLRMSLESAETVKMIYNVFIGQKIIFANVIMEMCDLIPHADCDTVTAAIAQAKDRLISPRYLRGGMGDGGNCHPRDQRALGYLARKLGLSANPFDFITQARIDQTGYLADVIQEEHERAGLTVAVMGLTFKPETNLTGDSPSLLLIDLLRERGIEPRTYDPIIKRRPLPSVPHVYVLATWDYDLARYPFVPGSVIVDVWRLLEAVPPGCTVRAVGRG